MSDTLSASGKDNLIEFSADPAAAVENIMYMMARIEAGAGELKVQS
jgi:hypothetical protein